MTKTLDVNSAQISQLIELAQAGNEIILARGETPLVRVTAIEAPPQTTAEPEAPAPKKRVAGLGSGTTWVSEDFDAPLPDSFWLGEE